MTSKLVSKTEAEGEGRSGRVRRRITPKELWARQRARELYQALPPEARNLAAGDLAAAQAACPHGLPIIELIHRAEDQMG